MKMQWCVANDVANVPGALVVLRCLGDGSTNSLVVDVTKGPLNWTLDATHMPVGAQNFSGIASGLLTSVTFDGVKLVTIVFTNPPAAGSVQDVEIFMVYN